MCLRLLMLMGSTVMGSPMSILLEFASLQRKVSAGKLPVENTDNS